MIQFLAENTTLMISIIVFMVCVIIGFFGDMYLKKHNKIQNIFNFKRKPKGNVKKEEVKADEIGEVSLNLQSDMSQEISSSIAPTKINLDKATLDAFENDMPVENKPIDMLDKPVTFSNVNVSVDDEINNMF